MTPELRRLVEDLRALDPSIDTVRRARIARAMRRRSMAIGTTRAVAAAILAALLFLLPSRSTPVARAPVPPALDPPTCAPSDVDERMALSAARLASVSEPVTSLEPPWRAARRTQRDPKPNGSPGAGPEMLRDPRQGALQPL